MRYSLFVIGVAALGLSWSMVANAIPVPAPAVAWTFYAPTANSVSIEWINGRNAGSSVVTYSPQTKGIWSYDGNLGNQSTSVIEGDMTRQFGLASTALQLVTSCDNAAGCTTGGNGTSSAATYSTGKSYFDYLAVHYGNGEMLFHFAAPVDQFMIQGLHNGLSNFRAYSDGVKVATGAGAVSEPRSAMLLIAGVMALLLRRHRAGTN